VAPSSQWSVTHLSVLTHLKSLFTSSAHNIENQPEEQLYRIILQASRSPDIYIRFKVSDNLDGRFDMLCLHMALIMRRLKSVQDNGSAEFSQRLFDIFFSDMDLTLREMGVGDLGVAKRVRKMSEAYMGRLNAYTHGLDAKDEEKLAEACAHNIGRREQVEQEDKLCAAFMLQAAEQLERVLDAELLSGMMPADKIFSIKGI